MEVTRKAVILASLLLHTVGLALFLKAFFPVKQAIPGHASWWDKTLEPYPDAAGVGSESNARLNRKFSRLIFVLIDALRSDFVLPVEPQATAKMDFVLEKVRRNESYSFLAKAHPPTVTMPRIKALTSGGIPGFVDVVLNFDSTSLAEDNIVTQLKLAGRRMVFYGDDTWMRLFPDHFHKTDGTTSFFVTDYTEVDDNVTRHLEEDLQLSADWDVLILHYLGLDHIGHLAGPHSPLVLPKLQEMDRVAHRIYDFLLLKDASDGHSSLLAVCGDHGMSDHGSHGGSTYSETATPFVLLSPAFEQQKGTGFEPSAVYQIDMVPGLSLLLGLPIPQNNLGILPAALLKTLTDREKLQWMYVNAEQLMSVFRLNQQHLESSPVYHAYNRVREQHRAWLASYASLTHRQPDQSLQLRTAKIIDGYRAVMAEMRDELAQSLSSYDLHAMAVAVAITWMALLSVARIIFSTDRKVLKTSPFSGPVAVAFVSSTIGLQLSLCTSKYSSDLLCERGFVGVGLNAVLLAGVCLIVFVFTCDWCGFQKAREKTQQASGSHLHFTGSLMAGSVLHTVSMLSSSFIEEEHQTWYFLTQTSNLCLVTCFAALYTHQRALSGFAKGNQSEREDATYSGRSMAAVKNGSFEFSRSSPVKDTGHKVTSAQMQEALETTHKNSRVIDRPPSRGSLQTNGGVANGYGRGILGCVLLTAMCRVARMWNQTGDKWAHLPDVSDWLIRPENKHLLSAVDALSLLAVCLVVIFQTGSKLHWLQRLMFCCGAGGVYCFRAALGDLVLPVVYGQLPLSKGLAEARMVYFFAVIIIGAGISRTVFRSVTRNSSTRHCAKPTDINTDLESHTVVESHVKLGLVYTSLQTGFVLIMLLIMRPHNISLVAMEMVQLLCVGTIVQQLPFKNTTIVTLIYLWLGQAAFFYQGNSNSIATVDVSSGYVGVAYYWPPVIGLLMCLSTYSGPILWHFGLVITLAQISQQLKLRISEAIERSVSVILVSRILPVAVYVILVTTQRYHLFVWTVFSPKLLYEAMHSLVTAALLLLVLTAERLCR